MQVYPGTLIVVEGIDGSGKSTVTQALHNLLSQKYPSTILTREPGGTPLGQSIRTLVQQQKTPLQATAEFLLFAADRAQHIHDVVKPALIKGSLVLSDRLSFSSECYQGRGRGVSLEHIRKINQWVMEDIQPDLIVYIQVDVATAFERINKRGEQRTSFEKESFIKTVAQAFDEILLAPEQPIPVLVINGNQSQEEVQMSAYTQVLSWLITRSKQS